MRYLTEVVCDNCGYREDTTEYHKECPVCEDGILKEVELDCECGKAYSLDDMEIAQNNYHFLKHYESLSTEQLWEMAWEEYADYNKEIWYKPSTILLFNKELYGGLKYLYSSNRQWCYGAETYNWEDYYQCECGKELESSNGW